MDLLRFPMEGGAIDYTKPYVLRTINDSNAKKALTAADITGALPGPKESPDYAVLLVNADISDASASASTSTSTFSTLNEIPVESLDKVIGISWYTAMKLMRETTINKPTTNTTFINKFFNITITNAKQTDDPGSDPNSNKSIIIGFIHGVHAYALAKGIAGVPGLDKSIAERYKWVVNYLKTVEGGDKGEIDAMWNTLCKEYLKTEKYEKSSILSSLEKLTTFLKKPVAADDADDDDAISIISLENLDDIAEHYGIHRILLNF